jgi:hypothetical protein
VVKTPPANQHHTTTLHTGGNQSDGGAGPGTVGVPEPPLPSTVAAVAPANPQPVIAAPPIRLRHLVTVGYQYPEVWLLPIALIVLIPFTLRALTKDLTRRR